MIARALRILAITTTLLVAVIAGALAGRAVASAILPDQDELSAIADTLVPSDAADLRADDTTGAGPQNLNVFVTPNSPTAGRGFRPAAAPEDTVEDIAAVLRRRGWRDADAPSGLSRLERGWLTAQLAQTGPDRVNVSVSHRPRWLFYLPSLTAAIAGALVLAVVRWRTSRRHRSRRGLREGDDWEPDADVGAGSGLGDVVAVAFLAHAQVLDVLHPGVQRDRPRLR